MSNVARIAALVVLVIAINVLVLVLVRVASLPDVDLSGLDIPGWVHTVLKVKNWVLLGVVLLVIVGTALEEGRRRREPDQPHHGDE
jgi:hypothetical protein